MATIVELDGVAPTIGEDVFLAPTAVLVGDVRVGDRCNIWFGTVLRGDVLPHRDRRRLLDPGQRRHPLRTTTCRP